LTVDEFIIELRGWLDSVMQRGSTDKQVVQHP